MLQDRHSLIVRFPLRLQSYTYITGEKIFQGLQKLAKSRRDLSAFKYIVKYLESEGEYWEMGLYHHFEFAPQDRHKEIVISYGPDPHSAQPEIKLPESYCSGDVYVENHPKAADNHDESFETEEGIIAAVKEIRDCLGAILNKE